MAGIMQDAQKQAPLDETLTGAYDLKADWRRGYESQPHEFDYWVDDIEGAIPIDLYGTLFRNGPGLLDINGYPLRHPFDGDGMVCSFAFANGQAFFRNRYVRTEGYLAEQSAGKILYRGVFGTQRPGGLFANIFDLRLKNVANTNIIHWGGKLLALWEAGEPYRLDPYTLDTLGTDNLNGALQPGMFFAAHAHIDPCSHWEGGAPCLINFSLKPGPSTTITLFEINQAGTVVRQQAHTVAGFAFLHDVAITPNYCIFFQNPVAYNPILYALGLRGAAECLISRIGQPTRILVIPRHHAHGQMQVFETDSGFVWHHANAFEQGDTLYIDSIWYDRFPSIDPGGDFRDIDFDTLPPGEFWRTRLNLQTGVTERHCISKRGCEFPVLHPAYVGRPYRYTYMAATSIAEGNAPLQAVLKLDLVSGESQLWNAGPRSFADEPIFVPRPRSPEAAARVTPDVGSPIENAADGEDNGWLLTLVYDAARHCSDLVILDARDLTRGPIAVLHLRQHIPRGLHGSFTSQWFGPRQS